MISKIKKIYKRCDTVVRFYNKPSKTFIPLTIDLVKWTWMNRGEVANFFVLGLYQKGKKVSDYLTFRSFKPYYDKFYPIRYICLLEDKLVFEKFINNFPQHAPENIGFISGRQLCFYGMDAQSVEQIVNYPMNCMIKNVDGFGGKNVFKLTVKNGELIINDEKNTLQDFYKKLPRKALIQKVLEQHEAIKVIHPSSVNTVRVNTVNTGSEIIILSTLLRVGIGNSVVDNFLNGGIYIPIDMQTNKLTAVAYSDIAPYFFYKHPQTNVSFEGIEIPFFKQALELCRSLHFNLPYFFLIGWDVAFTPTGPVIIEANNIHQVVHAQVSEGGLKKRMNAYMEKFFNFRDNSW